MAVIVVVEEASEEAIEADSEAAAEAATNRIMALQQPSRVC